MTPQNIERAKRIVSDMIRCEGFGNYSSERSNDFINDSDRANRCYEAAKNGADGSTHQERIQDMRDYWKLIAKWERRGHEFPYRVDAAVSAYLDSLESWHEANGTLFQEVG